MSSVLFNYDVIVVGAGVSGYTAAIRLAQLGAKVCIVEKDAIGGTCLNRGCIPIKTLLHDAALLSLIKRSNNFGINVGKISFNFSTMMQRKDTTVNRLVKGIGYLLKAHKIEIIKGVGKIIKLNTVEVTSSDKKIELIGKYIIIATGSEPNRPKWIKFDGQIITSDESLNLSAIPESIMVLGGGAIGCEFASLFSSLGSQVKLIEIMPQILPTEDDDVVSKLTQIMKSNGIEIYTKVKVEGLISERGSMVGKLSSGEQIMAEKVLVAIGRLPSTRYIGLENIGIKTEQGKILVNDRLQTNVPWIYAVGDVIRGPMLAHKAYFDGVVAAENIIGRDRKIDYDSIPNCIFTLPEIASIGMNERDAEKKLQIKVGKFMFAANGRAQSLDQTEGFVKIIAEVGTEKIIGAHIIGPQASELINEMALAVKNKLTISNLTNTLFAHPTLSECIKESASDIKGESIYKISKN